ncbi:MAG: BCCT family transporter [Pseudomonadota bacterium]
MSTTEYETEHETGQDNVRLMGMDVHNPVFFISAGLILLFAALTIAFPSTANAWMGDMKGATLRNFDWFFAATPIIVFGFCVVTAISPLGRIRLGGEDATPDFDFLSWVAMLFAAGVGIGFMFYGAAEPLAYFTDWFGTPLNVAADSPEARSLAFSATIFHWGLTPWAIYSVVGLSLAFFAYNKGLPLSIRSAFFPLLGERVWGWPGHVIDLLAVISTVFGLATTIGIGATQASSGLGYLLGWTPGPGLQIGLIAAITSVAIVSVLRGMDGGVKLLSNINMTVAFALFVFVFIAGPTLAIASGMVANTSAYAADLFRLSNWVGREDANWFHDWTIFYWAWWISWSPFVGMFIARISRGRTVREFISTVLIVPVIVAIVWFTTFGETAIAQYEAGVGDLADGVESASLVLFEMLGSLPFSLVTSTAAIFLLVVFIVTSADSGALVVDSITAGGKTDGPVGQRVFWAAMLGLTAAVLLYGGGSNALTSLQSGTIVAALPFNAILLVCCASLFAGMSEELRGLSVEGELAEKR